MESVSTPQKLAAEANSSDQQVQLLQTHLPVEIKVTSQTHQTIVISERTARRVLTFLTTLCFTIYLLLWRALFGIAEKLQLEDVPQRASSQEEPARGSSTHSFVETPTRSDELNAESSCKEAPGEGQVPRSGMFQSPTLLLVPSPCRQRSLPHPQASLVYSSLPSHKQGSSSHRPASSPAAGADMAAGAAQQSTPSLHDESAPSSNNQEEVAAQLFTASPSVASHRQRDQDFSSADPSAAQSAAAAATAAAEERLREDQRRGLQLKAACEQRLAAEAGNIEDLERRLRAVSPVACGAQTPSPAKTHPVAHIAEQSQLSHHSRRHSLGSQSSTTSMAASRSSTVANTYASARSSITSSGHAPGARLPKCRVSVTGSENGSASAHSQMSPPPKKASTTTTTTTRTRPQTVTAPVKPSTPPKGVPSSCSGNAVTPAGQSARPASTPVITPPSSQQSMQLRVRHAQSPGHVGPRLSFTNKQQTTGRSSITGPQQLPRWR